METKQPYLLHVPRPCPSSGCPWQTATSSDSVEKPVPPPAQLSLRPNILLRRRPSAVGIHIDETSAVSIDGAVRHVRVGPCTESNKKHCVRAARRRICLEKLLLEIFRTWTCFWSLAGGSLLLRPPAPQEAEWEGGGPGSRPRRCWSSPSPTLTSLGINSFLKTRNSFPQAQEETYFNSLINSVICT